MELFIWSCSTGANHWIKTRSRVTCGFYLSLQLPDTYSPPPKKKHTHVENSESHFTPGVFSSRVVISHWPPKPAVMTAKHIIVAGDDTDKLLHVSASESISTIYMHKHASICFPSVAGTLFGYVFCFIALAWSLYLQLKHVFQIISLIAMRTNPISTTVIKPL